MALLRAKIRWTIPGAGVSHSVLHFASIAGAGMNQAAADEVKAKVDTFINGIKNELPAQVTLQGPAEIEEIAHDSGMLIQVFSVAQAAAQAGTAAAASVWSAPSGAVISWSTGTIRNGRRVRGRTFIVPLSAEAYDTDGTIKPVPHGRLGDAANALRAPGVEVKFALWGRPSAPAVNDGVQADVTGHRVPDMAAILRSRRS
jgi:hypothetical protein